MRQRKLALPGGAALDLERRLSYRFAILSAKVTRSVANMYGPKYGLPPFAWKAMAAIGRYAPVSAKEVCLHITVEPDKVTRAVDRLVALGLVRREQDTVDRRRVSLSLSPAGRKVYRDIERATRRVELALIEGISAAERRALGRILSKLEARAEECLGKRPTWNTVLQALNARKNASGASKAARRS